MVDIGLGPLCAMLYKQNMNTTHVHMVKHTYTYTTYIEEKE